MVEPHEFEHILDLTKRRRFVVTQLNNHERWCAYNPSSEVNRAPSRSEHRRVPREYGSTVCRNGCSYEVQSSEYGHLEESSERRKHIRKLLDRHEG
jgi:hypothetical protein